MKILITGGCGFVGSNLAIFLKKKLKKAKIFSLDNLSRKGSEINNIRLKKLGIKNYRLDIISKNILTLPKFNLVIDCCAEPAIEQSKKNPDKVFNTNLVGTYNILKKIKKDNAKFIFLSTSRVYSIKKLNKIIKKQILKKEIKTKLKVDHNYSTESPLSLYGFSKMASENLIKEFNYMYKIKYIINRFGVISGPWQFGTVEQGFVSLWVERHLNKKSLSYIGYGGYGNQVRDVIHIDDVCDILYRQILKFKFIFNESFDIGGGVSNSVSLKQLTKKCQKLTKNKIPISKIKSTSIFDVPYFVTNNSKIKKYYNWSPKFNIDQTIIGIYFWLKKNKKILRGQF